MTARQSRTPLTDAEFRVFAELLRERVGLHFDEKTRFLVESRLARRIEACDLGSFAAYLYRLRHGDGAHEEFGELVDALTTHETYFFRERSQLDSLVGEVIPELLSCGGAKRGPVQVWSAGCASGEEPYSIVMLAREAGLAPGRDFRILASDVSRSVLARARAGVYRDASFRDTDPAIRQRYFSHKDGISKISDEVRRHVDFMHLNLVDEAKLALVGVMDVILCRNVIIYFDLATKKRVMKSFHERLRPGGCLLLGHSESLANVTTAFELKHLKRELVYRRPAFGEEPDERWHSLAQAAIDRADD